VAWLPNGEQFIVISGNQPSTTTLYDKNCKPLFEFGKRYRNTIRICPFSQLALIGGFGNLKGHIDLWRLDTCEEVGTAKSDCAITIDWSPDG
jgi:translation initiation factor 2A